MSMYDEQGVDGEQGFDANPYDAAGFDAGQFDAGPLDAGQFDAGFAPIFEQGGGDPMFDQAGYGSEMPFEQAGYEQAGYETCAPFAQEWSMPFEHGGGYGSEMPFEQVGMPFEQGPMSDMASYAEAGDMNGLMAEMNASDQSVDHMLEQMMTQNQAATDQLTEMVQEGAFVTPDTSAPHVGPVTNAGAAAIQDATDYSFNASQQANANAQAANDASVDAFSDYMRE